MAARSLSRMMNNFDNPRKARVYRREIDRWRATLKMNLDLGIALEKKVFSSSLTYSPRKFPHRQEEATRLSHLLSASEQVLITLRFLASGSFLEVVGDTFLSYDKSTVSRVIRRVTQCRQSERF